MELSLLEQRAEEATKLKAFHGINIQHIKSSIEKMLALFGRNGLFEEYTRHDITHVNEMLKICEWIIPKKTQDSMTLGDYLMLTLAIYFHDLGLLSTKKEYQNRMSNPIFITYLDGIKEGKYGSGLQKKSKTDKEADKKFIFQEFVRKNHAVRIKQWIFDCSLESFVDDQDEIIKEIDNIISHLPDNFKMDLSNICESHHLDDLYDLCKYKVDARYGNDPQELVNLQYSAIILRTADLLHITSDRTPSIQFNIINPENVISIEEWQKQMAVSAIHSKPKRDENGSIDNKLQPDEIEITAFFKGQDKADAYFGLLYYLNYVKKQFELSQGFIEQAQKNEGKVEYLFPWKNIDSESRVTTIGFENKKFQFKMNHQNILNLLVGHTLYNDSSVVLRELIQNSSDAVKLYDEINNKKSQSKIEINWNSQSRILTVTDSGTGMTVDDIENYFLTVGVSKYRTEEFKKKYPKFSPISRFGIGALSCFMLADDIDVITKKEEETDVSHVLIRNINNQYLLKKLKPSDDEVPKIMKDHGTQIKLFIRENVKVGDILSILKHWIMYPYSEVNAVVDGECHEIGYKSPKKMLETYIEEKGLSRKDYIVQEENKEGVTLAYATVKLPYYDHYEFGTRIGRNFGEREKLHFSPISLAIDGIRVESTTPGYSNEIILSAANITGQSKADTNVARSAVEENEKQKKMLSTIYELFSNHIKKQITNLVENGYSKYKAIEEAGYIVRPLLDSGHNNYKSGTLAKNEELLLSQLKSLQSVMTIDRDGEERETDIINLSDFESIKIISSITFTAIQKLMQENKDNLSFSAILDMVDATIDLKDGEILFCNYSRTNPLHSSIFKYNGPTDITINRKNRWVEYDYSFKDKKDDWIIIDEDELSRYGTRRTSNHRYFIPKGDFIITGLSENEIGVIFSGDIFLSSDKEITKYISKQLRNIDEKSQDSNFFRCAILEVILAPFIGNERHNFRNDISNLDIFMSKHFEGSIGLDSLWKMIDRTELFEAISQSSYELYNVHNWTRGNSMNDLF